jgi:hypothetical protein
MPKPKRKPRKMKGGITTKQLRDFVSVGYKNTDEAPEVDGYKLDKEISTKRSKVYVNAQGKAVITHAGTDSATDWLNNIVVGVPSLYKQTSRYKEAKKVQEKALKKYGKDNLVTVGHSQSGAIVNQLAKEKLTGKESDVLNPAILNPFDKHEGVKVIRSKKDIVSALTRKKEGDIDVEGESYNIIKEHQPDVLNRIEDQELGGREYKEYPKNHPLHGLQKYLHRKISKEQFEGFFGGSNYIEPHGMNMMYEYH